MKTKYKILLFLLAAGLCVGLGSAVRNYAFGTANQSGRKILCYQDSMHPWVKSDKPGKCTICAMDLTPIYEGTPGFEVGENLLILSSNNITVLNVQTEPVRRHPLRRTLRVAGTLEASETSKRVIAAGKAGRIERVAVPYAGAEVAAGEPLARFFIPDLLAEARRYILLARSDTRGRQTHMSDLNNPLLSALQNLRLFGLTEAQIETLAQSGKAEESFEILSPLTGTVIERAVSEGQYVNEGTRLFTIVDLSVLWFRFDAYEQDLPWLHVGQRVELTVPTAPGRVFSGPITFIEPFVNETTRTAKVRVDVTNSPVELNGIKQRLLRQQQYAEGRVRAELAGELMIPSTAVLHPGQRAYAYIDKGSGVYEVRELRLGRRGDEHWEVLEGLEEGDSVVTTGNVLLDAQAQFNRGAGPEVLDENVSETEPVELTAAQQEALTKFLAAADGVSRALAADQLDQLKPHTASLPGLLESLARELGPDHHWQPWVKGIQGVMRWGTPANLEQARESFLPFSTNVVAFVEKLRMQAESFRSLKVYHCPMAPKPGLWFQAQGPLRNPYYGDEMLTCGEEIKAPPVVFKKPAESLAGVAAIAPAPVLPTEHSHQPPLPVAAAESSPPVATVVPWPHFEPKRVPSFSQIQPINSRDHSAFENRMHEALAARFTRNPPPGTNALERTGGHTPTTQLPTLRSP